ncbi:MAG TPA: hypothetical protein VKU60_09255 [Chloroflexota bacterium]|nr:hypothetical protein [Chloroflexota bacterium]
MLAQGRAAEGNTTNEENEREFAALVNRLKAHKHTELPDRFRNMAKTMIIPALEEVAARVRELGQSCSVWAQVDEPIPPGGQVVYFSFDTRFEHGETSLCIRLPPGGSVVRIEAPAAGSIRTQQVPLTEFSAGQVQRVAIEYLRRAVS